jgi:molybdopterin-containing oxidoreductase family iron-sulfur binding subunit
MDNHHEEFGHKEPVQATSNAADLGSLESPAGAGFVPPRHWIGPEELQESYWKNPQVQEKRSQEFFEKPVEFIDRLDRSSQGGVARRDFLTIMGASMAMASFACARRPVHKIIPYVVKPEEITPGVANWYATTCQECAQGCGVLAKTREGRPIKLEGNPDHPLNQGSLCSRGQASVLGLYDPDRLKAPWVRNRADGTQKESDWSSVDASIQAQLKKIAGKGGRVKVLSGEIQSESTRRLIKEFLSAFASGEHVEFEPLALEEISSSQAMSYGAAVVPRYRFDQAKYVLSLGSDFLGNGVSPLEATKLWSERRKLAGQNPAEAQLGKLVCFESMMSLTGANADQRFPVRPGDELKVALAIAHELIVKQKRSRFAQDAAVLAALQGYAPEVVMQEVGIANGVESIRQVASELWENQGRGIVVAGSVQSKTSDSMALQVAVNLLNSALDHEGKTIDGSVNYSTSRSSFSALSRLSQEMTAGKVDALIVYRSNPAYAAPQALLGLAEAFKRVPLVIVVSEHQNETSAWADYVLPDHHYLENWGDAHPSQAVYSLQQPTMAPIHSSRAFQDSLLAWKKGGLAVTGLSAKALDWHDYLQNHWKETVYKEVGAAGSFDQFWNGALRAGLVDVYAAKGVSVQKSSPRTFKTSSLSVLPKYSVMALDSIYLALYAKLSMYDGRNANNAWLQELPDAISSVTWDNYVNVGSALAKKLDLKDDDVVEVSSGGRAVELPVHVQPGLHSQVVSIAVGYGRTSAGRVGDHAGVDAFPLTQVAAGSQSSGPTLVYAGQKVQLRKTGKFYKLAMTQWHTATENRPVLNDITLAEYKKNPAHAAHTDPHLRLETVPSMWPKHEYKGYRWGMAIDLTSCTGCSACMIACQAENNVPVVGRDQVRVSRQMHWIKIDRYYSGSAENPNVVFQPMLCQHCENAPCETVCPVLATVHDDEGLNVQVYNRCVGTRYCQNNCPYKVRRFNFFDHWKAYEGTANLVWNPDVTVRTRGIMEKCTFCLQRITDAKDQAKDAGDRVKDGTLKTACQQTCPADAIVFGDLNDPQSRVSKMKTSPQAFRVLEVLNTLPAVSYMSKVRNQAESAHSEHGAGHA